MFTDEPAVLTWMIALAPRPRVEPTGRHWWRELVVETYGSAPTEMREFAESHPPPTLREFMCGLSEGSIAP